MEFLWTAPDLNDILKKIEKLKLPDSVPHGKLINNLLQILIKAISYYLNKFLN